MNACICSHSSLQNETQDFLVFMTARYHLAVVSYDSNTGDLVTRAYGDVKVSVCVCVCVC